MNGQEHRRNCCLLGTVNTGREASCFLFQLHLTESAVSVVRHPSWDMTCGNNGPVNMTMYTVRGTVALGRVKVKVILSLHTMKAHGDLSGQLHAPANLSAIPIELKACWSSASFWTWLFWNPNHKSSVIQPAFHSLYRLCIS